MGNEHNVEYERPSRLLTSVRRAVERLLSPSGDRGTADSETSSPSPGRPPATNGTGVPASEHPTLTDEELVLRYLRPHGGWMRQSALVDCTDWSKSKVSRLLSRMEADDQVVRTPIGREKLVALPGQQPDAARSPFDDSEASTEPGPIPRK